MVEFQIKLIVIYLNLYKPITLNWLRLSQADLQLHLHLDGTTISTYVFISPETYWPSEIIQGDGGC